MSIRPFDMQAMVQKTPDMAKPIITEQQHPEVMQQNVSERYVKETLHNDERVSMTKETEGQNVNEDGKGGAEYRRRKERRKRGENGGAQTDGDEGNTARFDYSI